MPFDAFYRLPGARFDDDERKLVEFTVGAVRYGVDIMSVREIVNPKETIPVPSAPPYVLGVTDHRRVAVPVVDLSARLGLERSRVARGKWIIVKIAGMDVALLVEAIAGVTAVRAAERRELHPLVEGEQEVWVREAYGTERGLIFELDLARVIGAATELETGEAF